MASSSCAAEADVMKKGYLLKVKVNSRIQFLWDMWMLSAYVLHCVSEKRASFGTRNVNRRILDLILLVERITFILKTIHVFSSNNVSNIKKFPWEHSQLLTYYIVNLSVANFGRMTVTC